MMEREEALKAVYRQRIKDKEIAHRVRKEERNKRGKKRLVKGAKISAISGGALSVLTAVTVPGINPLAMFFPGFFFTFIGYALVVGSPKDFDDDPLY